MKHKELLNHIDEASKIIGKTWPLYAFVTSNPLSGYENFHFNKATNQAQGLSGNKMYPDANVYKSAWTQGDIDDKVLNKLLAEHHIDDSPLVCLEKMQKTAFKRSKNKNHKLDSIVAKWLMAFLDEGLAEWEMPVKDKGFFKAWRSLANYDGQIDKTLLADIPQDSFETLDFILKDFDKDDQLKIIKSHITALPGWTGYIKYRIEEDSVWQQQYSITLEDYLAVRLSVAKLINADVLPEDNQFAETENVNTLQYIFLKAWEKSFQNKLSKELSQEIENIDNQNDKTPDAQFVFCIDSRSELIRRHVESKGNYETFGYAGFFGIAMDYRTITEDLNIKSCPPILNSAYKVAEVPKNKGNEKFQQFELKEDKKAFKNYFLRRMKNMLPSAFGYVEGSGFFYGISLLLRTLIPQYLYNSKKKESQSHESLCDTHIDHKNDNNKLSLKEKTAIVKSAFQLTGWQNFAELIVFAGHGGHSRNNPYASSLDCGACAGSPGRHNARMLATLANDKAVRQALVKDGFDIPETTLFIGAEHNTTTDEIVLFDSHVPTSHQEKLQKLKSDLDFAQETATQERLNKNQNSVRTAYQKTNDWSETRPEWGLAKNNAFIIGSRDLTKNTNLKGHCFLHSYNWKSDETGAALEGIMQGPMVVTQWINNHYYFSTVDNENYGGGSKIFHNVTGKFGVVMGNGSDLKTGLPLQSVNETDEKLYHIPLRLSVFIHAPKDIIQQILEKNEHLQSLLDNQWIYLLAIDPTEENSIFRYESSLKWNAVKQEKLVNVA